METDSATVIMTLVELIVAGVAGFIFFELKNMRADLKSELKEFREELGTRVPSEVCCAKMQVHDTRLNALERDVREK